MLRNSSCKAKIDQHGINSQFGDLVQPSGNSQHRDVILPSDAVDRDRSQTSGDITIVRQFDWVFKEKTQGTMCS